MKRSKKYRSQGRYRDGQWTWEPKGSYRKVEPLLTSEDSPLRVDWVPLRETGRLGLTFMPGKVSNGSTGNWARCIDTDLDRMRDVYRTDTVVCLTEASEWERVKVPNYPDDVYAHGMEFLHWPIVDMTPPRHPGVIALQVIELHQRIQQGERVVLHCRGGKGRTGTLASCYLVARGNTAKDSMDAVQRYRKNTITRQTQREFVRRFAVDFRGIL